MLQSAGLNLNGIQRDKILLHKGYEKRIALLEEPCQPGYYTILKTFIVSRVRALLKSSWSPNLIESTKSLTSQQSHLGSDSDRRGARVHSQFGVDACQMGFDCPFRDAKMGCDLLAAFAARNGYNHFELTFG